MRLYSNITSKQMQFKHKNGLALAIFCLILVISSGVNINSVLNGIPLSDISALKDIARSLDGYKNNQVTPTKGMVNSLYQRILETNYADNVSVPVNGPNARLVSNIVGSITDGQVKYDSKNLSILFTIFGQFVDHDTSLTQMRGSQARPISFPSNDPRVLLGSIDFRRSRSQLSNGQRQQINNATAFLDLQTIYGTSESKSRNLYRTLSGGKLKVNDYGIFPQEQNGDWIRADDRAGSNYILFAVHILFHRLHNALCDLIKDTAPGTFNDEKLFTIARHLNIAIYQHIVYDQYFPLLLGSRLGQYTGYNQNLNPSVFNQISSAVFRYGHATLTPQVNKLDVSPNVVKIQGPGSGKFSKDGEATLKMLRVGGKTVTKKRELSVVDEVRDREDNDPSNFMDVLALDIQRCRDHGIATYGVARQNLGLPAIDEDFVNFTSNSTKNSLLNDIYTHPNNLELVLGVMGEAPIQNSSLGQVGTEMMVRNFKLVRSADRLWYENMMTSQMIQNIKQVKFEDLLHWVISDSELDFKNGFVVV